MSAPQRKGGTATARAGQDVSPQVVRKGSVGAAGTTRPGRSWSWMLSSPINAGRCADPGCGRACQRQLHRRSPMRAMPVWMARWPVLPKPNTSCGGPGAWSARQVLIPYSRTDRDRAAWITSCSVVSAGRCTTAWKPAARPVSRTPGACSASAWTSTLPQSESPRQFIVVPLDDRPMQDRRRVAGNA